MSVIEDSNKKSLFPCHKSRSSYWKHKLSFVCALKDLLSPRSSNAASRDKIENSSRFLTSCLVTTLVGAIEERLHNTMPQNRNLNCVLMSETLQNLSNMTLIKYVQTQFFKFDVNPTHLRLLNSGPVKSCHNDKFFLTCR